MSFFRARGGGAAWTRATSRWDAREIDRSNPRRIGGRMTSARPIERARGGDGGGREDAGDRKKCARIRFDSFRFDSRRANDARGERRRVLFIHGGGEEKDGGKGSRARRRD